MVSDDLHTNCKIIICQYIDFPHLKDCQVLSFCQIKICHILQCNLEAISSNFIPIIISGHMVRSYIAACIIELN